MTPQRVSPVPLLVRYVDRTNVHTGEHLSHFVNPLTRGIICSIRCEFVCHFFYKQISGSLRYVESKCTRNLSCREIRTEGGHEIYYSDQSTTRDLLVVDGMAYILRLFHDEH